MPGPPISFGKDELVDDSNPLPVKVLESVVPNTGITYRDFESITVSTSAVGLTVGSRRGNDQAMITVESAAVRFRLDGAAPTATVGHVLEPGDTLVVQTHITLDNVKFIRRDGIDATLSVSTGVGNTD